MLYIVQMLLFNDIEHLYSQNYIDVADKITVSDWWRGDKLQLADSELGVYFMLYVVYPYQGNNRRGEYCIELVQ